MAKEKTAKKNANGKPEESVPEEKPNGNETTPKAGSTPKTPPPGDKVSKFPLNEGSLRAVLDQFTVKSADAVAKYVANGDLSDAEYMDRALAEMSVSVNIRKPFLKYWMRETGGIIPPELERRLDAATTIKKGDSDDDDTPSDKVYTVDQVSGLIRIIEKGEKGVTLGDAQRLKQLREKNQDEGGEKRRPLEYVYDPVSKIIRFANPDERGGTLADAERLKMMADGGGGDEPEFIMDEAGNFQVNTDPKVKHTKAGMYAAMMMMSAQSRGQPFDPIEAMLKLSTLFGQQQQSNPQPAWFSDPVAFANAIKSFMPTPAATGPDPRLQETIDALAKQVADLKEEQRVREMKDLNDKIDQINTSHKQEVEELKTLISASSKSGKTGKNEIDVIDNFTSEGMNFIKQEGSGWREFFKTMVGSGRPLLPKPGGDKAAGAEALRQAVEKDKEIEALTRDLYFKR